MWGRVGVKGRGEGWGLYSTGDLTRWQSRTKCWLDVLSKYTPVSFRWFILYPRRRNVTTSMVGLKKKKTVRHAKLSPKLVNPRDIAGNAEEEEDVSFVPRFENA